MYVYTYTYQTFIKKHNQSQKRNEKKRKEINKKEEDVEDELANPFNDTMNISTKRRHALGDPLSRSKISTGREIQSDCFKKIKKDIFKDVTMGGACDPSLVK